MTITNRLNGLSGTANLKLPCRVATTAAITLSGLQTIDGVTVVADDRVLVTAQADDADNGIYVADTGDWERAKDFDGNEDVVDGTLVSVLDGTVNASTIWRVDATDPISVGTTDITLTQAAWNDGATTYWIQSGTGAVQRTVQNRFRDAVNVKDFGATGDGTTDDIDAIQAAIDAVCPTVASGDSDVGSVFFSRGSYRVTEVIDATSNRSTGRLRDGLKLHGDGMAGTIIVGETQSGRAIIETTGAQWLSIEDMAFVSGSANKSTTGIYQGLSSTLTQTQNQCFRRVLIDLHDDATANTNRGTYGIWNFGAEENTYDTVYITANRAFVGTAYNGASVYGSYAYSYQTLDASHSLGLITFSGECFLVSRAKRFPVINTEDVNSVTATNLYMSNTGSGGSNTVAWEIRGGLSGLRLSGNTEQLATLFNIYGRLAGADVRMTFGTVADTSTELIVLQRGGEGIISESTIRLHLTATANRSLLLATPSAVSELISCYMRNVDFITNLAVSRLTIPENLLANSETCNVTIAGLDGYKYRIGDGWQEIDIPDCTVLTGATPGNIFVVNLPTVNGVANAGGITVVVEGNLRIGGSTTTSMSSKAFLASQSIATAANGTPTISDSGGAGLQGDMLTTTQASVNAAGNDITAAYMAGTATGTDYVTFAITPTRAGANAEDVMFRGKVRMYWGGWSGPAPSLQRA